MAGNKATNNRKPYTGDKRALALAFDVGTTFSGVSYAFLEPGEVPKIHGVTRYPGQEHVTGNTKIPSLLYYDRAGNVVAAGAEAEGAQIADQAEDEGWFKVELFKLRLRPRRMQLDMNGMRLSPLPPDKTSEDVFGDFLHYLYVCTRKFIEDTHANGKKLWRAVEKEVHFVLSHPNGWEGAQQSRMRRAAISGGLIPNTDEGRQRIRFVTEGEASMHACILSGLAQDVLASGNGFIVADAGGGTLDISSYILQGSHPLRIEEIAPPDCVFSGAVFVSRRCRVFLEEKLRQSKYGSPDTLDHITRRFDETTKRLFRDANDPQFIPFGSPLDRDTKAGIRSGQLKLSGQEVAELFEPSIAAAVASIRKQVEAARGVVKAVWLVGGFAASPWLSSQLQSRLAPLGITVNRPDTQTSKAVADGAIGFFCDHHVSARMSRYMYGVEYLREINENDAEHVARGGRQLQLPSGPKYLPDAFDCILAKNVRVKESSVFSRKYYTEVTKPSTLSVFEIEIWCYRGGETIPRWIDRNSDHFGSLCFVRADLSKLSNSAEPKNGANGQTYWTVVFSIEIHFGLTEFKARMKWNEDGRVRYGPATIVFNEKGVRSDEDDAFSIAGVDSMPPSPRRPYGSLVSHRTTSSSVSRSVSQSQTHSSHAPTSSSRTTSYSSRHSHNPPLPPGPTLSRGLSMADMEEVPPPAEPLREPTPPPPPVARSNASTVRGSTRARSIMPEPEPEVAPESEPAPAPQEDFVPPPPSVHSRAPSAAERPSMSRVPSSATAERPPPLSRAISTATADRPPISRSTSHMSRTPSNAVPPSPPPVHSRTPTATGAPASAHSRAPSSMSAAAPPQVAMSRAPSTVRAPSPGPPPGSVHSHVPSVSRVESSGHSRAPSAAYVPSRAPSAAAAPPAPSPIASRAPSAAPPAPSPVASRAPSAVAPAHSPVASRAPSAVPAASPVVSRAPSAAPAPAASPAVSRAPSAVAPSPAVSRAPSAAKISPVHSRAPSLKPSRAPSLNRSLSHQSAYSAHSGSGSRSPLGPLEEAPGEAAHLHEQDRELEHDGFVDVRPPPGETAQEYFNSAPAEPEHAPAALEPEHAPTLAPASKDNGWSFIDGPAPPPLSKDKELPPLGGAPNLNFDFGFGSAAAAPKSSEAGHAGFGAFGSTGGGLSKGFGMSDFNWGKPAGGAEEPKASEEINWDAPTGGAAAPGAWDAFNAPLAPAPTAPEPEPEPEPPAPAPAIAPSMSKSSSKGGKKGKGILKNSKAAEENSWDAPTTGGAAAPGAWGAFDAPTPLAPAPVEPEPEPAPALAAPEPELEPEPPAPAPAIASSMSKSSSKGGKKGKGTSKNSKAAEKAAAEEEARAKAAEEEAARAKAEAGEAAAAEQERMRLEAEEAAARRADKERAAADERAWLAEEESRAQQEAELLAAHEAELARMKEEQEAMVRQAEEHERAAAADARAKAEADAAAAAAEEAERVRAEGEAQAAAEAHVMRAQEEEAAKAAEVAGDAAAAGTEPAAPAANDAHAEELAKLEAEAEKLREEANAKGAEATKARNEYEDKTAPKGKNKNKKKPTAGPAAKALERGVEEKEKAAKNAEDKAKEAEDKLAAMQAAGPPASAGAAPAEVPAAAEEAVAPPTDTDEFVDAPSDMPSFGGKPATNMNEFFEPVVAPGKKGKKNKKKDLVAAEPEEKEEEADDGNWGGKKTGFSLDALGMGTGDGDGEAEADENGDGGFSFGGGGGGGGWGTGILNTAKKNWFS